MSFGFKHEVIKKLSFRLVLMSLKFFTFLMLEKPSVLVFNMK